jgi:hypothetical protein
MERKQMQNMRRLKIEHIPYTKPTAREVFFDKHRLAESRKSEHFLVLLNDLYEVEPMMEIATALTKINRGKITAQSLVFLHRLTPLSEGYRFAEPCRVYLSIAKQYETQNSPVYPLLSITHNCRQTICNTIKEQNVGLVIGGFQGCSLRSTTPSAYGRLRWFSAIGLYRNLWHTLSSIPADTLLLRPHPYKSMSDYERILLPLLKGHHNSLAVDIAFDLAESVGQKVTIISELETEGEIWMQISRRLATCRGLVSVERIFVKENSFVSSILQEMAKEDSLLIVPATQPSWGARLHSWCKHSAFLLEEIIRGSETPIMIVKKHDRKTGLLRRILNRN